MTRIGAATVLWLVLVGLALPLGGCNTAEGIGRDVKAVGGAIETSARNVKREL